MVSVINAQEWKSVVDRVIAAWGGYQLGVDFSSGGSDTLVKDEWFKEVLADHISTSRGLNADDLELWLNNILYTEFNLILDDDSVYPTSVLLIEAFGYLKQNDRTRLDILLRALPSEEAIREANKKSRPEGVSDDEDVEMDDISEDGESETEVMKEQPRKERLPRTITDEDGWTTILRKA